MSNFSFVDDLVLQKNLDTVFFHIVDLLTLTKSDLYQIEKTQTLVSSLRKTIIIHTASIIEALLSWKLKTDLNSNKLSPHYDYTYSNWKLIHKLENETEIMSVIRKKSIKKLEDLDFNRTIDYCYKYQILEDETLLKDLHKVRKLRNRLHIGGLSEVEKEYSEADLEFCFKVTKKIKQAFS